MENNTAVQKPSTSKFGTIFADNNINPALITRVNNPSVSMLIGRVKMITIGLINVFTTPRTTANTNAPNNVGLTPGNIYAANKITIVEIIHVFIMNKVYHKEYIS